MPNNHGRIGLNHRSAFSNASITSELVTLLARDGLGPCSWASLRTATMTYRQHSLKHQAQRTVSQNLNPRSISESGFLTDENVSATNALAAFFAATAASDSASSGRMVSP